MALNTTNLAHRDAVWGGRQPSHLLALVEGLHVNCGDDPRLETHAAQRPADKMGAEAGLHPHDAPRELLECRLQCQPLDLLTHDQLADAIKPDQVKRFLTNVDTDHGKVIKASCLLCTHGYFSLLHG